MSEFLHGAYGRVNTVGDRVATDSQSAIVYIGTAPVHNIAGGANNVNKPILVNSFAEARAVFGYSENWGDYTLCEAMYVHLERNGVGPLVLINVFDPSAADHVTTGGTASPVPENNKAVIQNADAICIDSVTVTKGSTALVKGTDYSLTYDPQKKTLTINGLTAGVLGTSALSVTYSSAKPSGVAAADVIGSDDGAGTHTGIYCLKDVYQLTGRVPAYVGCPGFGSDPSVHTALADVCQHINGHWDAYIFADIPLEDNGTAITITTASTWKNSNGYNKPYESVYFPMALGVDGKHYHLSVLAAANFQMLLADQDGIPYRTASNTECDVISNLWLGASAEGRVYDDTIINENLNKKGISSAAFVGGRWVIWGAASADYVFGDSTGVAASETNRMMLFYLSNDFQHRRSIDVDKPMTANDLATIVSEEQTRIDALIKIGALVSGTVRLNATEQARSDMYNGDYSFTFTLTTAPLAKSLTAVVNWTSDGLEAYYADFE